MYESIPITDIMWGMHSEKEIPCPTESEVIKYLEEWEADEDMKETSKNLTRLFEETYPNNNNVYEVWIKVQVLNSAFNVNVPEIYKVAQHISKNNNIDVETIRRGHGARRRGAKRESDLYSFATKYCSFHNSDKYSIFDSNVERALIYFRKHCGFGFNGDLRKYEDFVCIIENFKKNFGLNSSFRDIDKYLYLAGRELNPPKKKS